MKRPAEILEGILISFDQRNKRLLAESLVEALDLRDEAEVIGRAEEVLERSLSDEERFRLEILARFFFSRPDGIDGGAKGSMSY